MVISPELVAKIPEQLDADIRDILFDTCDALIGENQDYIHDSKLYSPRSFVIAMMQQMQREVQSVYKELDMSSLDAGMHAFYGLMNNQVHFLIEERKIKGVDHEKYLEIRKRILQEIARRAFELFHLLTKVTYKQRYGTG